MQSPLYFRNNSMDSDRFRTPMKALQAAGKGRVRLLSFIVPGPDSPSPLLTFSSLCTPKARLWGLRSVTRAPSPGFKKNPHPSDSAGQLPRDSSQRGTEQRYAWPRAG